jgi:hypothetical protein
MGAFGFCEWVWAKSAREAFGKLVDDAQFQHGHGGYTGTIAEKNDFVTIELPDGLSEDDAIDYISRSVDPPDQHKDWIERWALVYDDKWGPALCIEGGKVQQAQKADQQVQRTGKAPGEGMCFYTFFGLASS